MIKLWLRVLGVEDQSKAVKEIDIIAKSSFTDRQKLILLGYSVLNRVDPEVLQAAVSQLGDEIMEPLSPGANGRVSEDVAAEQSAR
jgi:hypothetical protein